MVKCHWHFVKKGLCNCQHLLTTLKICRLVEPKFLWRSTRPFFPPPQIKMEKSGLGMRLARNLPLILIASSFSNLSWAHNQMTFYKTTNAQQMKTILLLDIIADT